MKYKNNQLFLLLMLFFSTRLQGEQVISLGKNNALLSITTLGTEIFATGSRDGIIRIFWHQGGEFVCSATLTDHIKAVSLISKLDDETFVSSSEDNTIRIWNNTPHSYSCRAVLTGHTAAAYDVTAVDDNTLISRSYDKTLKMWQKGLEGDYTCKVTLDDIPDIKTILSITKLDHNRISLDCGDQGTRVYIVGYYLDTIGSYLNDVIERSRYSWVPSIHDPEDYSGKMSTFIGSSRYRGCDGYDVAIHDNEIHIKEVSVTHTYQESD